MCKWYQLHKWKPIKKLERGTFLGEKYIREVLTEYRICDKCKLIQGFAFDSQGGVWLDEAKEFQEIILSKLKHSNEYILFI